MAEAIPALIAGTMILAACAQAQERGPDAGDPAAPLPTSQPAPPSPAAQPGPGASPAPAPQPTADICGADKLADFVNQLPSAETTARIRAAAGHDRIRTIRPGDAVTMDFRSDRLNIEVGADGRIRLFRCG